MIDLVKLMTAQTAVISIMANSFVLLLGISSFLVEGLVGLEETTKLI